MQAGNLRGVDETELSYLSFSRDENGERLWLLLPVWHIVDGYTDNPDTDTDKNLIPYYDTRDTDGSLTVPQEYSDWYYNAQTGEQLPATLWKHQQTSLPAWKVLTWEMVAQSH